MVPCPTLEVPLDSIESAILAAPFADRLELCDDLPSEGWSPTAEFVRQAREAVEVELVAMVRPRVAGMDTSMTIAGFVATSVVVEASLREIESFAKAGADSVAIGLVTRDGFVDMDACGRLADCARAAGMTVAFLRTFDLLTDRERGMRDIAALGVIRVVTAGVLGWDASVATLECRLEVLEADVRLANSLAPAGSQPIEVVVGGGVRWGNALDFLAITPHLHASCRREGRIHRDELAALRSVL